MSGELAAGRQRREGLPVPYHDEIPGLGVLGRSGPPTGVEDVEKDLVWDLAVRKLPHGPQRSDQLGFAHRVSLSVCFRNAHVKWMTPQTVQSPQAGAQNDQPVDKSEEVAEQQKRQRPDDDDRPGQNLAP